MTIYIPRVFLPRYGWRHELAGVKYRENEMSFRQTLHGKERSDRGFKIVIDRDSRKVLVSFDAASVHPRHAEWLASKETCW